MDHISFQFKMSINLSNQHLYQFTQKFVKSYNKCPNSFLIYFYISEKFTFSLFSIFFLRHSTHKTFSVPIENLILKASLLYTESPLTVDYLLSFHNYFRDARYISISRFFSLNAAKFVFHIFY